MQREDPAPAPQDGETEETGAPPAPHPFDLWLRRSLHGLYDGIAAEPVPPELLRLIEADITRRRR